VACNELVSMSICVICNKGIFAAKLCCLQRVRFRCQMVLPATKKFSLPNCIVCSELGFTAEWCCLQRISFRCQIELSELNLHSLLKLSCLQQICDLMLKLSCLQRMRELAFTAEIEVVAANERSLSKLSCLQRISICCRKCVFCSESVIRCRNWAISS